jgi:hypothetical protein
MNLLEKYKPFDFSSTRCFVVKFDLSKNGTFGIDVRLPYDAAVLKGILITAKYQGATHMPGFVSLMFNEGAFKTATLPILNTYRIGQCLDPLPVCEVLKPNSVMQGLYTLPGSKSFPGYMKIYLHYEVRK